MALLSILALLATAGAGLLIPSRGQGIWKDRSILLISPVSGEDVALSVLESLGQEDFLSESTEPVQVSSFSPNGNRGGLESLGLAEARTRLGGNDPRRDPYLEGLSAWFKASQGGQDLRIIYLRGRPGSRTRAAIIQALEKKGIRAFFPEAPGLGLSVLSWFLMLSFAFLALAAMTRRLKKAGFLAFLLLPLLPLSLGGLDGALGALLLGALQAVLLPSWELALGSFLHSFGWRTSLGALKGRLLQNLPLAIPFLVFCLFRPSLLPSLCLALIGSIGSGAVLACFRGGREGHRPSFVPLPILASPRALRPQGQLERGAGVLVVLALVACLGYRAVGSLARPATLGSNEPGGVFLPQPSLEAGPVWPGPAKAVALMAKGKAEIPNLADWLSHRWRQESLFFSVLGREYPPFAPLDLPFSSEKQRLVLAADQAWARDSYRDIPQNSVEALLSSLPRFSRVGVSSFVSSSSRGPGPLAPTEALLYIILMAPPMFGAFFLQMGGFRSRREQ